MSQDIFQVGGLLSNSQSQQSQLLRSSQYQDYVLYPDSGDFNIGLEADQIFRDIASTRWPSVPGYSAGTSEAQSIDSPLPSQQIAMDPVLQAANMADAGYDGRSPTSYQHSHSADTERHSCKNSRSSDSERGYRTVSGDGSRLDADERLSEVAIPVNIANVIALKLRLKESQHTHNHTLGANDQIPSDRGHILLVNDLIPGVSHIQQMEASHTPPMPSDQTAPSRQRSHRYITRRSQEDDMSFNQFAGIFDNSRHAVVHNTTPQSALDRPSFYLESSTSQVSSISESTYLASMSSHSSPSMRYTMPEESSRSLEQSSSVREDDSEQKSVTGPRGEHLDQTSIFSDPDLSGVVVQNVKNGGNSRLKKMVGNADDRIPANRLICLQGIFVHLCTLMAISILAMISLLVIGSDFAVDSVSGSFLQDTVSLYCSLPEFQVSGTYGALEFITMEPDLWTKYDLHSEPGLDETSYPNYHGIPNSGYSNSEFHDLVESWPVIPETELTAFGADLNYDTNAGQWEDSPIGFLDTPGIYGTPTSTITIPSPTIMPTMTSTPKSQGVDAMQTPSKASIVKHGLSLIQQRTSLLKHLNRDSILSDITLRMTSLRLG